MKISQGSGNLCLDDMYVGKWAFQSLKTFAEFLITPIIKEICRMTVKIGEQSPVYMHMVLSSNEK